MLKEFTKFLIEQKREEVVKLENGDQYILPDRQKIMIPRAADISAHSLSAIVDYVNGNEATQLYKEKLFIQVYSPTNVKLYAQLNDDMKRTLLIDSEPYLPKILFDRFLNFEEFKIMMQSTFVEIEMRNEVIRFLSSVKQSSEQEVKDDGVSQSANVRQGISIIGNEKVPNPVKLAPFRTFQEVKQPASKFVFRLQEGPRAALFEADGGAWRNEAVANIKAYFTEQLPEVLVIG